MEPKKQKEKDEKSYKKELSEGTEKQRYAHIPELFAMIYNQETFKRELREAGYNLEEEHEATRHETPEQQTRHATEGGSPARYVVRNGHSSYLLRILREIYRDNKKLNIDFRNYAIAAEHEIGVEQVREAEAEIKNLHQKIRDAAA